MHCNIHRFTCPGRTIIVGAAFSALGISGQASAVTQCVNQNAPAPLEFCVEDSGTPSVWVDQPNGRTYQYYSTNSWGSVIWLDGTNAAQRYTTGYVGSPTDVTPVTNTTAGIGTSANPYVVTTIVDLGASGVRMTQRFSYVDGDRVLRKSWSFQNTGATTYTDVRFFHGGDTYFGGDDSARSWYDADNTMVYVNNNNFTNSGIMGFFANSATPAAAYFGGDYSTGNNHAETDAQLPSTTNSNYVDAGYYLQWNRASLAPGQTWNIEAFEVWTEPGALQVLSPASDFVAPGTTVTRTFKVHNLSGGALSIDLSVLTTPDGWTVNLPNGSNINLNSLEVTAVPVEITVPANAVAGTTQDATLTATDGATNTGTGTTRLTLLQTDFTISPNPLDFGTIATGSTGSATITLDNSAGATSVDVGQIGGVDGLAAPFSITADTCSGQTIPASGSCTLTIAFDAAAAGTVSDTFDWPVLAPIVTSLSIGVSGTSGTVSAPGNDVTVISGGGGAIGWMPLAGLAVLLAGRLRSRRTLRVSAVAALLMISPVLSATGWYAGAQVGRASTDVDSSDVTARLAATGLGGTASVSDANRSAWKLYGGYSFNAHLAVEAGWTDLDEITTRFSGTSATDLASLRAVRPSSGKGPEAAILLSYPFSERFSGYGRLGVWRWRSHYELINSGTGTVTESVRVNDTDAVYGLGLAVRLDDTWSARLSWDRYRTDPDDTDLIGLGINYHFGN